METPLMKSAVAGNISKMRSLIAEFSGRQNERGFTALMRAISYKQFEAAKLLVSHEAGASADNGQTALMLAAQYGSVDLVKALIPHEAGQQNANGWTALMFALNNRQQESARLLASNEAGYQNEDGWTALMFAAQAGYIDIMSIVLDKERRKQSKKGWTALMLAADTGITAACQLLIDSEAGMRKTDGVTAMMIAARNGYLDIVRLLFDKEFGFQTVKGKTAYSYAFAAHRREICQLLQKETREPDLPPTINEHILIPVEQTLQVADLNNRDTYVNTVSARASSSKRDEPDQTEPPEGDDQLDIDSLKETVKQLTMRLNSSDTLVEMLQRDISKQASQINELYLLVDELLQSKEQDQFTCKIDYSTAPPDLPLNPIPIHPDCGTKDFNPDPSTFDFPQDCLRSSDQFHAEKEENTSMDNSIDVVCLPCEHICHFKNSRQLEDARECIICEEPINDYIEINTK